VARLLRRNLAAASAVALVVLSASRTAADAAPRKVTCSFSHPAYSGYCKETQDVPERSTPAAVCQEILGCLNSTGCSNTYCNATTIREGWRLEKVETPPAPK
jgi:hypothetical protein